MCGIWGRRDLLKGRPSPLSPNIPSLLLTFSNRMHQVLREHTYRLTVMWSHLTSSSCGRGKGAEVCYFQVISLQVLTLHFLLPRQWWKLEKPWKPQVEESRAIPALECCRFWSVNLFKLLVTVSKQGIKKWCLPLKDWWLTASTN